MTGATGIFIRGMDMPPSCRACPLSEFAAFSNCKLLQRPILWDEFTGGRQADCPLSAMAVVKTDR